MNVLTEQTPNAALQRTRPRLLPGEPLTLRAFAARYGPRPAADESLFAAVEASGLTGRGGAGFPTVRKLRSVRAGRGAVVVANGAEGEPLSAKDKVLLARNPHLVLDGALVAADLVRSERVIVAVARGSSVQRTLEAALAERRDVDRVSVAALPDRFISGEESALVHWLNGGEAKPTLTPPRPFERGVDGRPTLVQNVETLANLALVARYGSDWFRCAGTAAEPGTVLATVSGVVSQPGVVEVSLGIPLPELLARCGGVSEPVQAYLIGGYFGRWVEARDDLSLSQESLGAHGGSLGARTVVAFGARSCGVVETARVVGYLAGQSAEQCGPCLFGLRALTQRLALIARSETGADEAYAHLERLERQIARRGACAHPDGVLGFVASATRVFNAEFARHLAGRCSAYDQQPVLPTPASRGGWR